MRKIKELSDLIWLCKSIKSKKVLEITKRYDMTIEDLKKVKEFFTFFKNKPMKKERGFNVMSINTVNEFKAYLDDFGVIHNISHENEKNKTRGSLNVLVNECNSHDPYGHDDTYTYYIEETLKCNCCNKITGSIFKTECNECKQERMIKVFNPII